MVIKAGNGSLPLFFSGETGTQSNFKDHNDFKITDNILLLLVSYCASNPVE